MNSDRYIIQVRYSDINEFIPIAIFKGFVDTGVIYNCAMDCVDTHDDVEEAQVWDIITKTVLFSWSKQDNYPGDDCNNDCGYDPYLGCFTDDC